MFRLLHMEMLGKFPADGLRDATPYVRVVVPEHISGLPGAGRRGRRRKAQAPARGSRRDLPRHGHFQLPLAQPLIGVLPRKRMRPLVGDGADLADFVAAAAQVGADGRWWRPIWVGSWRSKK